jgi:hypothetical protein
MSLISEIDLLFFPFFLFMFLVIAWRMQRNMGEEDRKVFKRGLLLRFIGCITFILIIQFYYKGGDTFLYYRTTVSLNKLMREDPAFYFKILFSNIDHLNQLDYSRWVNYIISENTGGMGYMTSNNGNVNICKIASIVNWICFDSYFAISMFFALLSFIGCWHIYKVLMELFPGYRKVTAMLTIYLPSLFFWGTGLLKDPICLFGVGMAAYYSYKLLKRPTFRSLLLMLLFLWLCYIVKSYIAILFSFAFLLTIALRFFMRKNMLVRILFFTSLGVAMIAIVIQYFSSFQETLRQISLDELLAQSQTLADSYASGINQGESGIATSIDFSPLGILQALVEGIINVLLRPFPWEFNKFIYMPMIIENIVFISLFFVKIPTNQKIRPDAGDSRWWFFSVIVFAIMLALLIGLMTYNFGTIVRYRLPLISFLYAGVYFLRVLKKNNVPSLAR